MGVQAAQNKYRTYGTGSLEHMLHTKQYPKRKHESANMTRSLAAELSCINRQGRRLRSTLLPCPSCQAQVTQLVCIKNIALKAVKSRTPLLLGCPVSTGKAEG
jgi:hypothetical protein